jgi:hypothetical protein
LRRIFTGSYSLPPPLSSRHVILQQQGTSPLPKSDNQMHNYISRPAPAAAQRQIKPMAQKASMAHQTAIPGAPRVNLRLARGAGTAPRNSPPRSRARCPLSASPPRSRASAPSDELSPRSGGPGPSCRSSPRSRPPLSRDAPPGPPTGALNTLMHRGRLGQR